MYYPKSQITPNLYTDGGEYFNEYTLELYQGYYYKTSNGKFYTGKNPDDKPNVLLIQNFTDGDVPGPRTPDPSEFNFLIPPYIPYYSPVIPTQQDYQIGEFRRYFCKKTNEIIYIEINQKLSAQLVSKDVDIVWSLYQPFYIDWHLIGDKQQVARINKNSVDLVSFQNKFPRLDEYLKLDFIKYYQPEVGTMNSGSYINGVNQGYVLDNRNGRGNRVPQSQINSGSVY